jgi:hypothetical protein
VSSTMQSGARHIGRDRGGGEHGGGDDGGAGQVDESDLVEHVAGQEDADEAEEQEAGRGGRQEAEDVAELVGEAGSALRGSGNFLYSSTRPMARPAQRTGRSVS